MRLNCLPLWLVLVWVLMLSVTPVCAQPSGQGPYRVLIDPAHGGTEAGVTVSSRVVEKDITLAIALSLKQVLEAGGAKVKVQLTRTADKTVSLGDRIKIISTVKPDLVISLHANAGFDPEASGFEISFPGQKYLSPVVKTGIVKDMEINKQTNDNIRLAQMIQKNLETVFPRRGRGIREVPVPLLNTLSVPGVCVEMGFLTNKNDKDVLLDKDGQKNIARALGRSIRDYFNL
jgi:N-acetylmuramoyl-L-alanine amidase